MPTPAHDLDLPPKLLDYIAQSRIALSLGDDRQEDCPLVAVSDAFCEMTGYSAGEVLGRNCRFLQPAGGAGPVRERMRGFITDPARTEERFLIPNERKDGTPFLNLVYMTKLSRGGRTELIVGSQFDMNRRRTTPDAYDAALRSDLRGLSSITSESDWAVLGTMSTLATSSSIIAQARLDG